MTRLDQTPSTIDVETLLSLLEREADLAQKLIISARKKQEAIISRNRVAFEQALSEEGSLINQMQQAEQERMDCLAGWAPPHLQKLSDLLPLLPEPQADEVSQAADRLSHLLSELDVVNQQNAGLIIHSLAHVQMLVSALVGDTQSVGTYGPSSTGPKVAGQTKSLVDWRA